MYGSITQHSTDWSEIDQPNSTGNDNDDDDKEGKTKGLANQAWA